MLLKSLAFLLAAVASALAQTQAVYDTAHNATPITGTWSSGSMSVSTGFGFANPNNMSFTVPKNTGISYSFNEANGWFEIARYRMIGNGSDPHCITIVLNWNHGQFTLNPNGSMTLKPAGDGYQQIQNACFARSDFVEPYNATEDYQLWQIFMDATEGPKFHMFQFDGTPVPPMRLLSQTPNMLPTQLLRNVSSQPTTTILNKRSTNVAPSIHRWSIAAVATVGAMLGGTLLF